MRNNMIRNKINIFIIFLIIIFIVSSTILYFTIKILNLGNDLGVILGFLFGICLFSLMLFLDLLLDKHKKEKEIENE